MAAGAMVLSSFAVSAFAGSDGEDRNGSVTVIGTRQSATTSPSAGATGRPCLHDDDGDPRSLSATRGSHGTNEHRSRSDDR